MVRVWNVRAQSRYIPSYATNSFESGKGMSYPEYMYDRAPFQNFRSPTTAKCACASGKGVSAKLS